MAAYQRKPCRRCGGEKGPRVRGSCQNIRYCDPCARVKQAEFMATRAWWCGSCSVVWGCDACAAKKRVHIMDAARRGGAARRKSQPGYFRPEDAERYWQHRAHAAVQAGVRNGLLPSLKAGEYACTDCGGVACEYDHRDYSRPLEVAPVCKSCNRKRGTAVWPSATHYQFRKLGAAA